MNKFFPPYTLFSDTSVMKVSAYTKENLGHLPYMHFFDDPNCDQCKMLNEWQASKITVKVHEDSKEALKTIAWHKRYDQFESGENNKDFMTAIRDGIDITSLADRLEFYQHCSTCGDMEYCDKCDMEWFVRLLPEQPGKVKEESWDDILTNMIEKVWYCITNYDGAKRYFEENYLPPKQLTGLGHNK